MSTVVPYATVEVRVICRAGDAAILHSADPVQKPLTETELAHQQPSISVQVPAVLSDATPMPVLSMTEINKPSFCGFDHY
jgi:hypothetical protein